MPVVRRAVLVRMLIGLAAAAGLFGGSAAAFLGWSSWKAAQYRQRVQQLIRARQYTDADLVASAWLRLRPGPEPILLRCRARWLAKRFEEAAADLLVAAQRGADLQRCELERCLLVAHAGQFDQVEPYLRRVFFAKQIRDSAINEALAVGYSQRYDLNKSQHCLNDWIEFEPDNARPWLLRGQIKERVAGERQKALADFQRAVELDSTSFDANLKAAELAIELGRPSEAEPYFRRCTELQPESAAAALGLGRALARTGNEQQATEWLHRALQADPDLVGALVELAVLDLSARRVDEAVARLKQAAARDGHDQETFHLLSVALLRAGDKEGAAKARARSTAIAELRQRCGRLQATILEHPDDASAVAEIIRVFQQLGSHHETIRWANRLQQIDPDHVLARSILNPDGAPPSPPAKQQ